MGVPARQIITVEKLSQWAEQDKTHRFYDLYHLLHHDDWLRTAQAHVRQNAGSQTAGCDGVTMKDFEEDFEDNLKRLQEAIKSLSKNVSPLQHDVNTGPLEQCERRRQLLFEAPQPLATAVEP
jgi:retron-type reverse transcriptase